MTEINEIKEKLAKLYLFCEGAYVATNDDGAKNAIQMVMATLQELFKGMECDQIDSNPRASLAQEELQND